ncbi:MAG: hypothetical protein KF774_16105 [Planctomyces sp.]|nr:hypothetical protein [Planctomyces sp.]
MKIWMVFGCAALAGLLSACDVDVRDPGQLPEVDVRGGRMPDMDVNAPDVDVRMEERTIDVPTDIDVRTEERTIDVPTIDVRRAEESTVVEPAVEP